MHKRRGFTIVELLIVVVVIVILASIVLVSYSGVQQRARNTATLGAANSWIKAIQIYYTRHGQLNITDIPPGSYGACLGDSTTYPSTSHFNHTSGDCRQGFYTSVQLSNALATVGTIRMQPYEINAGGGDYRRGVQYAVAEDSDGITTGHWYVIFDLEGKHQSCSLPSGIEAVPHSTDNATECAVDMTDLLNGNPVVF